MQVRPVSPRPLIVCLLPSYYPAIAENWHSRKNKNVSVSGSDTEAELVSLLPATMYVVRVLAINQIGSSEPGSDTHIKTHNEGKDRMLAHQFQIEPIC